ncbi:MAG: hypothetical protein QW812_04350 [Thermoplasmataceae archaeon]
MKIGIIGSGGRIGSALLQLLAGSCTVIPCSSPHCNGDTIERSDFTFLCVPETETLKILNKTEHPERCIEVTSVKTPMTKFAGKIVSIHPLFGPKTAGRREYMNIVFVSDLSIPGSRNTIEALFPEYRIIEMTSSEHDKFMLSQIVFPYLVSILQKRQPDPLTYSARMLDQLRNLVDSESRDVVRDNILMNPYIADLSASIMQILENPVW